VAALLPNHRAVGCHRVLALLLLATFVTAGVQPHLPLAKFSHKTLTFAERVAYQRAIEEVYWRHRIWPRERSNPKPPVDVVMSQAHLEKKVADYLRRSQALEDYWQRPITAEQLQAEMDRMAEHTKQPEVLHELFEALGNDPFVIAECLVRPALAEHLPTNSDAYAQRRQHVEHDHLPDPAVDTRKEPLGSGIAITEHEVDRAIPESTGNYTLPQIASDGACIIDTWTPSGTANAPSGRSLHTAIWTGSEMIVWGGTDGTNVFNTGARYNPSTDSWAASGTSNAPTARALHAAVWTGSEMIVWGGGVLSNYLNSGGRYDPVIDSWTPTNMANAPSARELHTAVWSGSEMIVWGGLGQNTAHLNTGARYNPVTDSWAATSTTNNPGGRQEHTSVWTGSEMIVWGGVGVAGDLNTGGRYNPITDDWTIISTMNAPSARIAHTSVWTGNEMIVWGGSDFSNYFNTGGRYNPSANSWTTATTINAPSGRSDHTAVWTGSEMIVWGGADGFNFFATGGRYAPSSNSWIATSTNNAPAGRVLHTAIFTDSQMVVWGGNDQSFNHLNTGGRYCAQVGPTPTPTPCTGRCTPTPRPRPTQAPRP
jgi:N-acetylneuraminic acid mutarotase